MAQTRKQRRWREKGNLRGWVENSNDITAIATRAQLPSTPRVCSSSGSGERSKASGERSETSGKRSADTSTDSGGTSTDSGGNSKQVTKAELGALKALDVIAFNKQAEAAFVELLSRIIVESGGELPLIDAIRECAFALDVSTETIKRYLLKHTARAAQFVSDGKVVRIRC